MYNQNLVYRAVERIETFMNNPSFQAQKVNRLLFLRFPEQFGAADREFLFLILYTTWPAEVSITLETGLFVKYNVFGNVSFYREPGNSGYDVSNVDMQKHYTSCIDSFDGTPQNCTMDVGNQYVKCIDNCALVKCTDSTSQSTDCSNITTDTQEGLLELRQCQEKIKWCRSYEIKSVVEDEQLGYIPETGFCINERGQPEERDGYVLKDAVKGTFGNCYYLDGKTKVNRVLEGNYAYCNSGSDINNGNSSVACNGTFYGGFIGSRTYNSRLTDWYKMTKQFQQPLWSDPYQLHDTAGIGLTYTEPIYSYQRYGNQTVVVFNGVVSVDYYLSELDSFLREQFSSTTLQVIVVEQNAPNYVIASSHGTNSTSIVSKRTNTTSEVCTHSNSKKAPFANECTSVRIPILEFNSTTNDRIYQRAYLAHKQSKFKSNELVSLTESDSIVGSKAYISESYLYIPAGGINLNWYIITVFPMSRNDYDTAQPGDVAFTITCILATIGFVVCFWLLALFYKKRNEKIMIQADWRFTCAFVLGCTMLNLSSFALLGESTDSTCLLRMWSFHFLFACALSPLYVKVWRMYVLLEASKTFTRTNITNTKAFLLSLPIILAQTVLLLTFTFVDPSKAIEELQLTSGEDGYQTISCGHNTNAFLICQVVFDALLLATGCYLAIKTWNLDPKFGEAKPLAFCMYNITLTGALIVLIANLVDMENESQIMLVAFGILWGTVLSSTAFVLPRYMKLVEEKTGRTGLASLSFNRHALSPNLNSIAGSQEQQQEGTLHPSLLTQPNHYSNTSHEHDSCKMPTEISRTLSSKHYDTHSDSVPTAKVEQSDDNKEMEHHPSF